MKVQWHDEPQEHDYSAAESYLSLVADTSVAQATVQALRASEETHRQAKDILRASGLELLSEDNKHVAVDLARIETYQKLSPILLVRGCSDTFSVPLTIADGYHRVCASYWCDENTEIPCRIGDWSWT